MDEDKILSAEVVFSIEEIFAEYMPLCEEATETHSLDIVKQLAPDLCRALDRDHRGEA